MKIEQILTVIEPAASWHWIRQQYLPTGPICPGCGSAITGDRALAAFARLERTYCKCCGSNSPARAFIPVLRGTEWLPEEYCKLLLLNLSGLHAADIAMLLGKSASCVRDMIVRINVVTQNNTTGDRPPDG